MLYSHLKQQLTYLSNSQSIKCWVLALSGGLDSRVLLHLLGRYKTEHPEFAYKAVYIHHGLSSNADFWQQQCADYCRSADIDFACQKVSVDPVDGGLEQAARNARYQALSYYIDEDSVLLLAQHATDQVETFLLALKRGSGVTGLSAMPKQRPFDRGTLFRPLLDIEQPQIADYAQQHQLDWVTDESNQNERFDRNFIRHQVTPLLKKRWPHIGSSVVRSARLCGEQTQLLNDLLAEKLEAYQSADGGLSIAKLQQDSEIARRAIIRQWLSQKNHSMPSEKQLNAIWNDVALAQNDAAPQFYYSDVQLGRHQNHLYVFKKTQDISEQRLAWDIKQTLSLPDGLGTLQLSTKQASGADEMVHQQRLKLPQNVTNITVCFKTSYSQLVKPDTRAHHRSLKKLLQEYQVPTWHRRRLPLLMIDQELVAIAGLFVSEKYSANNENNDVLYQLIWTCET